MAWRLGQWVALLKSSKSKLSRKLRLLLHQKLSEQFKVHLHLEPHLGNDGYAIEEIREMRNLLQIHCRNTGKEMSQHRMLQVSMERCFIPFPVATVNDSGTSTNFLPLDSSSNTHFTNYQDDDDDVVVKREVDGDIIMKHEDDDDYDDHHHEDFEAIDFEMDFDFPNYNQKHDSDMTTMSISPSPPPTMAEKKSRNNVAVEQPAINQEALENTNGIACESCGKVIPTLEKLQRHYKNHNDWWRKANEGKRPPAPFQCHFCWQTFTTQQMRWVHQKIGSHDSYMTSAKFTCSEEACTGLTPFSTFEDLETHFENVHRNESESVYKCSLCSWPFSSDDMRQVHELVHGNYIRVGNNKSFKCPRCDCQVFKKFPPLQTHFILEHTNLDSKRIHKCHKCTMAYRLPKSLTQHLKTHEMEEDLANTAETGAASSKYFICDECGKHCATSRLLGDHKFHAHRWEQCSLCGETLLATALSRHMWRVHKVAEDLHPCPVCQKLFHEKYRMRRHMKNVHPQGKGKAPKPEGQGEVCHICSKTYQRKGLLHRHLRIAHQIEAEELKRPARFVCPDCGMGYYYKASLHAHIDAKHRSSEQRRNHFPCTLCSKTFWRRCLLMKHLEEAHPQHEVEVQNDAE